MEYFYFEGDYHLSYQENDFQKVLDEAERLLNIAREYDGKVKSPSFEFILGDIMRIKINNGRTLNMFVYKKLNEMKREADKIYKRNK